MGDYGYKEVRRFVSKDEILMRVTQEEIFKHVFGFLPRPYKYLKSPYRDDSTPRCYFEWYRGTLWFIDWAEPNQKKRHRDCFNAIQDFEGISFYESLRYVNKVFKLNLLIEGTFKGVNKLVRTKADLEPKIPKEVHPITVKARYFDNQIDRDFWQPFHITKDNLIKDNVFPIIWYKIFSRKYNTPVLIRPQTRSYMIGEFEERKKIYTPDKKGKGKWATNCKQNDIWGYKDLPLRGEKLVITKSYKDRRVLFNNNVLSVALQNEGMYPSKEILEDLCDRFKEIIVFFDNDRTGIEAAEKLVNILNEIKPRIARSVHLKESLLRSKISDPSDLIKRKGKKPLNEFIIENRLSN